jgi:hypothetical protein
VFVIVADQVDSSHRPDLVDETLEGLEHRYGVTLVRSFERTAGDEIQGLTDDAETALAIVLELTREGSWSVGLGLGSVREPVPDSVRAASGKAFVAARAAINAAKRAPHRVAIRGTAATAVDPAPLLDLLLQIRSRRSIEGWQVYDLLRSGLVQAEVASRIAVTTPVVSQRVWAAGIRLEEAALPSLAEVLGAAEESAG